MAFEGLSSKLQEFTKKLRGNTRITESDLKEMLKNAIFSMIQDCCDKYNVLLSGTKRMLLCFRRNIYRTKKMSEVFSGQKRCFFTTLLSWHMVNKSKIYLLDILFVR